MRTIFLYYFLPRIICKTLTLSVSCLVEICLSHKISFSLKTQKALVQWPWQLLHRAHNLCCLSTFIWIVCLNSHELIRGTCSSPTHAWLRMQLLEQPFWAAWRRARGRILCGSKTWSRFIMALVWFVLGESFCWLVCPYQICFYNKTPLRFYSVK